MKKQFLFSYAVLIAVLVLVIVRIAVGYEIDREYVAGKGDYDQRAREEWDMAEIAEEDAQDTLRQMEEHSEGLTKYKKQVKECLQYGMNHFKELEKGTEADSEIILKLIYVYRYLSHLYYNSDYDQRMHTKKEKLFWRCLVNKYVYFADCYVLQITSNHQEKEDLLKADHLAQKLSKNLDEEVDIFVDRLADVVDEGKRGESFS